MRQYGWEDRLTTCIVWAAYLFIFVWRMMR